VKNISKIIDSINESIGKIFSWLAYVLLFVVLFEVFSSKIFDRPRIWSFELSYILYAVMFLMGFGYTLKNNGHVRIDIFYDRFSKKTQGILDVITFFLFFVPFVGLAVRYSWVFMMQSWQILEHSQSAWAPPIYLFKTFMPIAFFLLFLQGVSELIKAIYKIKGEK